MPLLKQHTVGEWVRRLRLEAEISLRTLASRTGFSPSFISQVENGQVSPSISSMERIADALGVTLGEFFAAAAGGRPALIVRAGERLQIASAWSHGQVEALGPSDTKARIESALLTLASGGRSGKHPYAHDREELAFVLTGEISLTLGPEEHTLHPGDAVTIRPGELRLWQNKRRARTEVLIVSLRASAQTRRKRRGKVKS
jgi:transcriptional regulator with XRE-family HTH domain